MKLELAQLPKQISESYSGYANRRLVCSVRTIRGVERYYVENAGGKDVWQYMNGQWTKTHTTSSV